jgi:thiol-disulfide isomerase/thioredoxin
MKNVTFLSRPIILIEFCLLFLSCTHTNNDRLPDPKIQAGIAKISGTISNLKLPEGEKKVSVEIFVNNPVTGEEGRYATILNENNQFSLDLPLECSTAIVGFNVRSETKHYCYGHIGLKQEKELQMNIVFDDKGDFKIDVQGGLDLAFDDMLNIIKAINLFEDHHTDGDYYKMTPSEFAEHELTISLKERTNAAIDSLPLSGKIKKYLTDGFNLHYLRGRLFYYKEDAEKSFKGAHIEPTLHSDYTAIEPDQSYYSFLREFNLNNPQYLYSYSYSEFMNRFLSISAFKITKIKDQSIEEWLGGVKATIKDVIGFDSGLFYDLLAANAYALQMNDSKEPLTDKQVKNITNYYKNINEDFSKILIKKNAELLKSIERNNDLKVNQTPVVSKEKLMDAIIAKYKGSVILVDFWATWCIPCMNAHRDMKPLKDELKKKGVVFVYMASSSSPKPLWEGKIKGIGGEQYYLASSEWEYVMNSFAFNGIPSYLIYDKNGALKNKFTGFQGTDKMREMINVLLP